MPNRPRAQTSIAAPLQVPIGLLRMLPTLPLTTFIQARNFLPWVEHFLHHLPRQLQPLSLTIRLPLQALFSWEQSAEGVSVRCDDHQSAVPHMTPSGESRSHPASADYLTQNDKTTKEKDDMSSGLAPLIISRISRTRTRRMDPRNVDRRQPWCFINNRLLRWTFYAVLCWLLLDILQSFLVLRRPLWPEGYRPVFTAPDVLPVYQRFQGMRSQRRGAKYEGVNLHHLCANASDAIGHVNGAFRDVLFEALIIGPRIAVEEIDPKTISSATQQLDQVIYIARHVTKNVTESSIADETSFWKTAVVRDFEAYREIQLL
ncbi:hypothetical protein MRS44_011388 [Fusarium solani]|uniref:uncharacterized protein n=1 Tax=Fusarium solani TaxID=169388 RepID=UPI0032C409DE|nr:hypothetical protein MRS44_011388 [Fusarium solani]